MEYTYIILDDHLTSVSNTKAVAAAFHNLKYVGSADNYNDGLDMILEVKPDIVIIEIQPSNADSKISLLLLNELHRYLKELPKVIVLTNDTSLAYESLKYELLDYCIKPLKPIDLRKAILKFEKSRDVFAHSAEAMKYRVNTLDPAGHRGITSMVSIESDSIPIADLESDVYDYNVDSNHINVEAEDIVAPVAEKSREEKPLIICVKSYGDYRFIEAKDICYLQADNNSTDIHLYNGEMITAFKTLKHFETVLASPFVRIHNSYIVNIDYISRIHTGNSICYIKNTTTKLPFSKSYKENVDSIINSIITGNYLEI